jgi:hypothetical protein
MLLRLQAAQTVDAAIRGEQAHDGVGGTRLDRDLERFPGGQSTTHMDVGGGQLHVLPLLLGQEPVQGREEIHFARCHDYPAVVQHGQHRHRVPLTVRTPLPRRGTAARKRPH